MHIRVTQTLVQVLNARLWGRCLISFNVYFPETGETAQQRKTLGTKTDDLSLIPRAHIVEAENSTLLTATCIRAMWVSPTHMNKCD